MNHIDFMEIYTKYGSFMTEVPPPLYHALIEGFNSLMEKEIRTIEGPIFINETDDLKHRIYKQAIERSYNKMFENIMVDFLALGIATQVVPPELNACAFAFLMSYGLTKEIKDTLSQE